MSWQSWAANELNQVATYPSPYVNVHNGNDYYGGSIGLTCLLKRENLAIQLNVVSVCITMEELSLSVENFQNVRLLSVVGSCQKDDFKI